MEFPNAGEATFQIEYWLQWQVLVCALIFILPTGIAVNLLRKRSGAAVGKEPLKSADLWEPCWRNLHPRWLLLYRAFAFVAMAVLLYLIVAEFGAFVFFFYTQWTFALVTVYFAIATVVSIRGCRIHKKKPVETGEGNKLLKKKSDGLHIGATSMSKEKENEDFIPNEQLGFLENLLPIVYQMSAGASMLTDIVFWCLLLPLMSGETFQLTLLMGCMHSVNAVFLILESALTRLPFNWFGIVYFIFFSCAYVVFQWALHACCFTWWPYPFLDLSTPFAPLWYLALALIHLLCHGLYLLVIKATYAAFSRMFPQVFIRVSTEKKQV